MGPTVARWRPPAPSLKTDDSPKNERKQDAELLLYRDRPEDSELAELMWKPVPDEEQVGPRVGHLPVPLFRGRREAPARAGTNSQRAVTIVASRTAKKYAGQIRKIR